VRPKSANTIPIVEHYVRDYLIKRFGEAIAEDVKPLEIQKWLKSLNETKGLAWTTISKIRGLMHRIYKIGILHEHVEEPSATRRNALQVQLPGDYHHPGPDADHSQIPLLPASFRAGAHLRGDRPPRLGGSGAALVGYLWDEGRIRVSKRWAMGKDGETKTEASDGYVPLHSVLAHHLRDWHTHTPYAKDTDFVFPSLKARGRVPLSACVFLTDHLRPAAIQAGVHIEPGQRFGLHNLRHSLSNWLVNKAKVEPKTVQGILRHSRIQTTLDLYTQEDSDEARAAQGEFLEALGMRSEMVH